MRMDGTRNITSRDAADFSALAERAARAAGFNPDQAQLFAQAAALHLSHDGASEALLQALGTPKDSPARRLPLLLQDILRAARAMPGTLELTLHPDDTALAMAYVRLLPIATSDIAVVADPQTPPRLRLCPDLNTAVSPDRPASVMVPQSVLDRLTELARQADPARS